MDKFALDLEQMEMRDSFSNLMVKRVYNILLIASKYDSFILEEDGRIDEKIFNEYTQLNLRYPPRFMQVVNEEAAIEQLQKNNFELIIFMPGDKSQQAFEGAKRIKKISPNVPIVMLTPFSREVSQYLVNADTSAIDYVFSWLGNTDLLLAIVKLIEDKMNVEEDVKSVGVQVIMLVEDSIRFYSSILPDLYKYVLEQSRNFATEALNAHHRTLRMRGRPKILLARSYEEATSIYKQYQDNMLGVISDVSFTRNGMKDSLAGQKLSEFLHQNDPVLPIIIDSSEASNKKLAEGPEMAFIQKGSKTFPQELRQLMTNLFGFGDFVFRDPKTGQEVARIHDLQELQKAIFSIPDDSLRYHFERNHASRWLFSRAMFPIGRFIKHIPIQAFTDTMPVRQMLFDAIVKYRKIKNEGVIAEFQKGRFDKYSNYARIGDGSLGGKARGLAFLSAMIKRHPELNRFADTQVMIPKTLVLCTNVFDEFMEQNNLYDIALQDLPNEEILEAFRHAHLPEMLFDDLVAFVEVVKKPIAVRSSSLLEDAHYQPFAGIYSTYMIPYDEDPKIMLKMLRTAIKGVYASVFFDQSKAYMTATSNVIDQEKMAVVIEEVCGSSYGNRFYPTFSGVARSLNYYPIGQEETTDGIANVALGLGKYIVDGGLTLRFSPKHPKHILQMSTMEYALRETQTSFLALDLNNKNGHLPVDDGFNLLKLPVKEAEQDGTLDQIASTFDPYDQVIRDGIWEGGRKIISFAHILENETFPLAELLSDILKLGEEEMGRHVEIEFAVNLNSQDTDKKHAFYLLQIRPIVDSKEQFNENLNELPKEDLLMRTNYALGQGIASEIFDIVYVSGDNFNATQNQLCAYEIDKINKQLTQEGRNYVLIGPGRWGSSDPWLGIPVRWPNIASARLIVETSLNKYQIDPSQGTHFFQNLTSFGVHYYTIPHAQDERNFLDLDFLNGIEPLYEDKYLKHYRFDEAMVVKTDGKKGVGILTKAGGN
ncbi:MAG: phosphoenolpyruvate synthase [Bacteroidales bacterium]|nr:phosphoenolpyruvate synthase [Bacteroidales bacterium]MBR0334227.1 phosphoenolpyruvate synthase [Bacteroidales bacterium]